MILVDTGPLVALCDARDPKHGTGVTHLKSLARDDLATCEAVLTEACFHLPSAPQRQRLRALLAELNVASIPAAHDPGFWLAVFDWLARYANHQPDWADACLAVLSGQDKRSKVWTYDREFRTTWRRPGGSRIPLAVR